MKGFVTLSFLFIGLCLNAQNLIEKYPGVKELEKALDSNDSLQSIILENEDFIEGSSDDGGELIGFYDAANNEIRKIALTLFLSYGIQYYSFYLKNEQLVLVRDRTKYFGYDTKSNRIDKNNFDGGFSGIYIFRNKQLIDQISTGHNRFEDDSIDAEETFLKELEFYKNKISEKLESK
ncbi:hypothetical protein [Zunongwangia atlantica]|uniref:Uncharacterized protein n=1 Tax=Zunongwangia atlantica 22II14-10F7 TaxID=1185767 RepID=A0A1Y1T6F9_9FLAO|nr:hypothetical protein [Zunongwangia atlantica]ORL46651.1 hypothetical protein IIF7_04006 [Zunongwangia atlantica 22II14-10F7]